MSGTAETVDFNNVVRVFERIGEPMTGAVNIQTLDRLDLRPGERLIDVAAGAGAMAVVAAERGARVLATDIAPAMVDRAAERLRLFPDCNARTMSFDALDVPDASFDVAVSFIGVLAFAEWRKGLDELVRVTRPGGRIGLTMWTQNRDATVVLLMKRVFEAQFPGRELYPANFHPDWSVERLEDALRQAGCDRVEARVISGEWSPLSASGDLVGPADVMDDCDPLYRNYPGYRDLTEGERDELRGPVAAAFAAYAGRDGVIHMPTQAYEAIGYLGWGWAGVSHVLNACSRAQPSAGEQRTSMSAPS